MNYFLKNIIFLTALLEASSLIACPIATFEHQMSSNAITEEERLASKINEADFDLLVERISETFTGLFKKQGLKLKISANWNNPKVNAFSDQSGSTRYIYLFGGYARYPMMDKDTFLSVICHEVGHHLGGFPRESGSTWASAEGQADYYSTLKCMKMILKDDIENEKIALSLDLPNEVKDQCRSQFIQDDDYFICLRSAKASEIYGKINASLATPDSRKEISLLTPDKKRVASTNLSYPLPQCRVDTKFQGALCNVDVNIPLGYDDENKGACSIKNGNTFGVRPTCWFIPRRF